MRLCKCLNALGVRGVGEATIVKQATQREREPAYSDRAWEVECGIL